MHCSRNLKLDIYTIKKLEDVGIKNIDFPSEIMQMAEEDLILMQSECNHRIDMTHLNAFTIDNADCFDMDDALSFETTQDGFRVGIHIADVSAYIQPYTLLDEEALERGTSIYLPGLTIPMLPDILTKNLCSLKQGETRNTLSLLIDCDKRGNILGYKFCKALIRSRLKGVYSEVNCLLEGDNNEEIMHKYAGVRSALNVLNKFAAKCRNDRIRNGAVIRNDNDEPLILIDGANIILEPNEKGSSEKMIEELMILANRLTAEFLIQNKLPGIFRHQDGNGLRAYYDLDHQKEHAELACHYLHFTAPIRRYADIEVHRVISYYLDGKNNQAIEDLFWDDDPEYICDLVTRRGRRAYEVEIAIKKFCYIEFFTCDKNHGRYFTGVILSRKSVYELVIRIDRYNINIIGSADFRKYAGKAVSFRILADGDNKRLKAAAIVPVNAA